MKVEKAYSGSYHFIFTGQEFREFVQVLKKIQDGVFRMVEEEVEKNCDTCLYDNFPLDTKCVNCYNREEGKFDRWRRKNE